MKVLTEYVAGIRIRKGGFQMKNLACVLALVTSGSVNAQFGPPIPQGPVKQDFTGTWVSVVTEDWLYRMTTPRKETNFRLNGLPLTQQGKDEALRWDPQRDAAEGNFCKAYGAGNIMRLPARLRISEPTSDTLKIEIDAGTQIRTIHFGPDSGERHPASLQGYSVGQWPIGALRRPGVPPAGPGAQRTADAPVSGGRPGAPAAQRPAVAPLAGGAPAGPPASGAGVFGPAIPNASGSPGATRIITRDMIAGYVRKNGVPYSAQAKMTEYLDRIDHTDGTSWLILTTIIEDPQYFTTPYVTSSQFRKEQDDSKWRATPCEIALPL